MRHCLRWTERCSIRLRLLLHAIWPLAGLALISGRSAHADPCYDLSAGEPKKLRGHLQYTIYPGPPNFEDVRKGDRPEPTYVLRLDRPICLKGDKYADPNKAIRRVQLVGTGATWPLLRASLGQRVSVGLKDPMGAETGHHHEPLVARVMSVKTSATRR
jgi:hypothetical protein